MVDVREGEGLLAFLMAALYFLLLVTYYLLKPARDSLFLTQVGPEQLPVVFVLIALVAHPVVTLHARAARRLSLKHLLYGATAVLAASLVALRLLLMVDGAALLYVVYVWVSIYGALTVSQFWLLANRVFNAAQAKRLFTLLNTGAMLGAFFGGEVANALVDLMGLGTANLLLVAAAVLVSSLVLVRWVLGRSRPAPDHSTQEEAEVPEDEDGFAALVQTIRGSRLLVFIVALVALEMMTSTFVDYQFKTVATRYFGEEERLTGFLATFYGRVSLIALGVQVVVLPRLLTRFGVGSALLVMPVSLLLGTAGVLIVPGIVTVTLLRGADQTFEHSADKVGRELLFLPIPMQVKRRVKVFIDVFVDRVFRGLAGVLLLGITLWLGLGPRGLSVVVLGLLAAWITTAFLAQRSYVDAFREALREGQLEMKRTWTRTTSVGHALSTLQDGLDNADDPRILFALQALAERNDERIVEAVRPLLSYPARDVRCHALRVLRAQPSAPPLPEARQHLLDEDAGIQQEAFHYQFLDREDGVTLLQDFLDEASPSLQAAAAACAVRFGTDEHTACLGRAAIDALLHHDDAALRAALAEVLARADEAVQTYLADLARDDDPEVRRAAVRSMGIAQHDDFVPILIHRLRDDPVHVEAWNALSRYGGAILDDLIAVFEDPDTSALVRRRLPRVLSAIPEQRSVDLLMSRLQCTDPVLRHNVTTALHRLRLDAPDVDIPQEPVEDALRREAGIYYSIAQSIQWAKGDAAQDVLQSVPLPEHVPPLNELLDDHLDRSAKRIFYLLGLYCPEHAVRHAYTAYTSEQEHLRALAVEWLNSVLDYDLRQLLGPIIDPPSFAATAQAGERLLGERVESLEDVLLVLIDGPDPRLQACAFYHAAAAPTTPLIDRARQAVDDVDERVRNAAAWMLEHVSAPTE
jgi:ATP/ADP translocase/HEAT repeat protein